MQSILLNRPVRRQAVRVRRCHYTGTNKNAVCTQGPVAHFRARVDGLDLVLELWHVPEF